MTLSLLRYALIGLLAPAFVLAAACGGGGDDDDDDGGDDTTPAANETATTSDDDDDDDSTPAAGFDEDGGSCDVTLTGDVETEFSGAGGAAAIGADYFLTDDERKQVASFLGEELTDAEVNDDIPDVFLFIMNCNSDDGDYAISFLPAAESTYADMPFGPGEYVLSGGMLGNASQRGEIGVIATLDELSLSVSEPGEFNITEWDDDHIEGNFTITMTEPAILATGTPKSVNISGEFNFENPN